MKRYQILIPLSILVMILAAACGGTAGLPQTGQAAPTQSASAVPGQSTDVAPQPTEAAPQATDAAPQTTDAAPQPTEAAPQPTEAAPQTTEAAPSAGSPSATGTAPATGNSGEIPTTGQTDNKPQSSVGELPNAQPADMQPFIGAVQDLPEGVRNAVATYLVNMLNVDPEKVLIVSAIEREYNNACLGLALEGEACAEVITPGWLAIGIVNGSYYVVHTNEDGTNIRMESPLDNAGLTNFGRDFPFHSGSGE